MNKFEAMKASKDGLDVLANLLQYAAEQTPVDDIPEEELDRMKWYGVFHRKATPGFFMMRLRTPGGQLSSIQLEALAEIARDFGRGTADLTTRQNIQLRWLTLPDIPEILRRLAAVGITTLQSGMDNMRNLIGCPLAGLDADEVCDTTPILLDLHRAFLGRHAFSNLPRKFNMSIAGCREDCGHAQTQDLGFLPASRIIDGQRRAGFNVLVGGAMGGTSPHLAAALDVWLPPDDAASFTLALLAVYRDNGPREQRTKARLKWLLAAWGKARLRSEVEARLGHPLLPAGRLETRHVAGDHVGVHRQRGEEVSYVGLHVPVGRISADQLAGLGRLAKQYGGGEVRLTVDQNVVIPSVANRRLPHLLEESLLQELRPDPPSIWRNLVCCTGSDYCHFSLIDTKSRAVELARTLEARGLEVPLGTRIQISGCINACGKHQIGDLGLLGTNIRVDGEIKEAVDVFVGGKLGPKARLARLFRRDVVMDELPDVAEALLRLQFQQTGPTEDAEPEALTV